MPNLQKLSDIPTPFYQINLPDLRANLERVQTLCELSGAKALLALKCFATWGVFDAMRPFLHGTTSSSLNEVRLGSEEFGGETHAYSVAYAEHEIDDVLNYADKIIFNSFNQLNAFKDKAIAKGVPVGLRLNPQTSNSEFIIADPARPFSRLGEHDLVKIKAVLGDITGVMIHNNCENDSFEAFDNSLSNIEAKFGEVFHKLNWVSLGGGIHFVDPDYPLEKLATRLKKFSETYGVQLYLEPGEACIHGGGQLVTTVLDTLHNGKNLAVVDASIEAHMLDLLIYRETAPMVAVNDTECNYPNVESESSTIVYGKSCLAGDIFGEYQLTNGLQTGDRLAFGNALGYTMVKKNWFNGVNMPSIVVVDKDDAGEQTVRVQREFDYSEFKSALS